ncbi:hypothetical protein CHARACLAT_017296 [Characodon lateralis]|uniref:Uncharacterized protein n=1 Tax=Characodon lateralis TaxID=208331 RepID=A0ABU7END9_9TELE|nr:hypothetical protein [Characodon lateralis]
MQADIRNTECEGMAKLKLTLHESEHRFRLTVAHEYTHEYVCLTERYSEIILKKFRKCNYKQLFGVSTWAASFTFDVKSKSFIWYPVDLFHNSLLSLLAFCMGS